MTVKDLYEWAKDHNALDCNIELDFCGDDTDICPMCDMCCNPSLRKYGDMCVIKINNCTR